MIFFIPFIGFLLFFVSCSPMQFGPESHYIPLTGNLAASEIGQTGSRSQRRNRADRDSVSENRGDYEDLPLDSNVYVDEIINKFSEGPGRSNMTVYLERSTIYVPLIQNLLKKSGLPEDLAYVPMAESGFSPWAVSSAGATGLWQFMDGTAGDYHLRMNQFVDERRDVVLSTKAAIKYLKSLYNLFGDWYLALAAYHAGESFINKAVFNSRNRDFWDLAELKKVGPNTREYIPKVIAFTKIAKNPGKYDFYNLNYRSPLSYELVRIRQPSSLRRIADKLNIPLDELKSLNPMYLGDYVPVYDGVAYIRIPDYI